MSARIDRQVGESKYYEDKREIEQEVRVGSAGKYNIETAYYPTGLTEDAALQHFVMFYINVRGKSKFDTDKRLTNVTTGQGQNRLSNESLGKSASAITALGAGVLAGGAALKISGNAAKNGSSLSRNIGRGIGVAVASVGAGAATYGAIEGLKDLSGILKPDTTSRISDAIALQVDERPSVRYSVDYANKELGTIAGGLAEFLANGSAVDSTASGLGAEAGAALLTNLANFPSLFGSGATIKNMKELSAKAITNPFREVFFEAVDFRTFNFKYRFFPTSSKESYNAKNIIDRFKFHMHPELSDNGLFLIYPSEFEIVYYFRNKENTYFHKISSCVLTDMQVDYGGENFSSFADGAPTEINLNLTFRELESLTKERIKAGY